MENNNSKQAVLSIIGIAILVIAVVGVSFAFFSYSREGEQNNTITTGKITFSLDPGEKNPDIIGTNSFPKSEVDALAEPKNQTEFKVSGDLPKDKVVKYTVYAIEGDVPGSAAPGGTWHRLDKDLISMKLEVSGNSTDSPVTNNYATAANPGDFEVETEGEGSAKGFVLATGQIKGTGVEAVVHSFILHMWVNNTFNEGKIISDTDSTYTYRASSTTTGDIPTDKDKDSNPDNRYVWSDMYYSVKVKVVATDQLS